MISGSRSAGGLDPQQEVIGHSRMHSPKRLTAISTARQQLPPPCLQERSSPEALLVVVCDLLQAVGSVFAGKQTDSYCVKQ